MPPLLRRNQPPIHRLPTYSNLRFRRPLFCLLRFLVTKFLFLPPIVPETDCFQTCHTFHRSLPFHTLLSNSILDCQQIVRTWTRVRFSCVQQEHAIQLEVRLFVSQTLYHEFDLLKKRKFCRVMPNANWLCPCTTINQSLLRSQLNNLILLI